MLESMEALIREYHMLPEGCSVLCAVSGGADSVCLLHALYRLRSKLGFSLTAAHYNHLLRGEESDRDAQFVAQFVAECCGETRLPDGQVLPAVSLISGSGDVSTQAALRGAGVEETARDMRYAFLRQAAAQAGASLIATAHNADDNGETVLFHLARGSGLRGLAGIPPIRDDIIRPLLSTTRQEIEAYLTYRGLPWREDHSNQDDLYARNRIRHQVMPVLNDLFPGFTPRLAGCTARWRADEEFLSQSAQKISCQAQASPDGVSLPAALIAQSPDPIAVRAVRQLIGAVNGGDQNCSANHLEHVVRLCRTKDPSAQLDLPYGLTIRREYDLICFARRLDTPELPSLSLSLPGETLAGPWRIQCSPAVYNGQPQRPFDFWLSPQAAAGLTLRSRRPGDRLHLLGRPTKSLKKWFIDEKIPRIRRDFLPVFMCREAIAAVAGLGPDADFLPHVGQAVWHITITPLPCSGSDPSSELSSGKEVTPPC